MSFSKKLSFFKNPKGGEFAVECVSNGFFPKNVVSALIMRFFQARIQKPLNVGKIRKYDDERVFF